MNQRIQELWRECVLKHTRDPMNWQAVADEFAELIIRECGYCADVFEALGCPVDMAADTKPSDYIKKHFGVVS